MSVLAEEHGSFYRYLRSLDALDYYQRVKVLTSHFAGLGRTGAFVFLHCVNEETPSWDKRQAGPCSLGLSPEGLLASGA